MSRLPDGRIRDALKTPYRDGTTHVRFEPLDFLARLAALVPNPGVNLTRYHGVFAPNHRLRAQIVPRRRGRGGAEQGAAGGATPRHLAMHWAQRLKRVFGIDMERCEQCGGAVRIIASIEDPEVIAAILEHLGLDRRQDRQPRLKPYLRCCGVPRRKARSIIAIPACCITAVFALRRSLASTG